MKKNPVRFWCILFAAAIVLGGLAGYLAGRAVLPFDVYVPCISEDKQLVHDYITHPEIVCDVESWVFVSDSYYKNPIYRPSAPEIDTLEAASDFAEELFKLRYSEDHPGEYTVYKVTHHTSQGLWKVILCPVECLPKPGSDAAPAESFTITFTENCGNVTAADSGK